MKTIIVEDNPQAADTLKLFLREYGGNISLVGVGTSIQEARRLILEEQPELWLLDIRLHDQVVFTLLRELGPVVVDRARIIFMTGYDEPNYLHQAIQVSAVDYLVKPIDKNLFFAALDKAIRGAILANVFARLTAIEAAIMTNSDEKPTDRLSVERISGEIELIHREDIVSILTEDSRTSFYLTRHRSFSNTRLLIHYENLLAGDKRFLRISRQAIINVGHIASYHPRTLTVRMDNDQEIQVSRRNATALQEVMNGNSRG